MANVLGFGHHGIDAALATSQGVLLFGAFLPLTLIGFAAAWRLGRG